MSGRVASIGLSVAIVGALVGAGVWLVVAVLRPGRTNLPVPVAMACTAPWGVAALGLVVAGLAALCGRRDRS